MVNRETPRTCVKNEQIEHAAETFSTCVGLILVLRSWHISILLKGYTSDNVSIIVAIRDLSLPPFVVHLRFVLMLYPTIGLLRSCTSY